MKIRDRALMLRTLRFRASNYAFQSMWDCSTDLFF